MLEEEVTELLGRVKSARRAAVDAPQGYRNRYGKPRRLAQTSATITARRPRVRGLGERFESRVLPLFARRTQEVGALLPALYRHGLAQGDFELALRGLLGGWRAALAQLDRAAESTVTEQSRAATTEHFKTGHCGCEWT